MGTPFQFKRVESSLLAHHKMSNNKEIGDKYGIHPREVEKIKFAFDVYDFKGDGKVDGFYIGDLLRACNLNPTLATIDQIGGQKDKGKKSWSSMTFILFTSKLKIQKIQEEFMTLLKF